MNETALLYQIINMGVLAAFKLKIKEPIKEINNTVFYLIKTLVVCNLRNK